MRQILFSFFLTLCISLPIMGQRKKLSEAALAARIDANIKKFLTKVRKTPGKPISDETFLRKIYLDIVGRIPTLEEANNFLNSRVSDKRAKLIDLLQRSPGYVSHNFNYWADSLRILERQSGITKSYSMFLKESLQKNTAYDVFVREMLTSKGSLYDYKNGAVNYYMRDKSMPIDKVNVSEVEIAVDKLNNRPRTCLKFKTLYEVFQKLTGIDLTKTKGVALMS